MPISSYPEGKTYVAFLDISGFKEMMKREEQAAKALDKFYTTVYNIGGNFLNRNNQANLVEVDAIIVSDCAVLFSRNSGRDQDKIDGLRSILSFIQLVNRDLIGSLPPLMTTCSIDYGQFKYEDRIEFNGIGKEYFVGQPYLNAFLDNEHGKPKIQPGQCRLLKKNLELSIESIRDPLFSLLDETRDQKYYYFYWMLDRRDDIEGFEREYQDTYQLKYTGMISVLKKYVGNVRMGF